MKKKILGIILARSGSKRIKNKNIKKFKNKPLINWTIDTAIKSNKFCNIIVSSDSFKILEIAKLASKKVLTLKRPKNLSVDTSSSEISALHALKWYEKKFSKIDYIALLQPTSPFRTLKTINKSLKEILNPKINAVISIKMVKSDHNNKILFYLTKKNFCKRLGKKKCLKPTYAINGIFYLIKKSFFIKNINFSPSNFKPIIIHSKKENVDIDTIEDFRNAKKFI
mgnify:CR=1 FL=1|tara:strand:+ start:172 stop:846 length:675 start_codon:yes stop_codon:yes gene_type:complete